VLRVLLVAGLEVLELSQVLADGERFELLEDFEQREHHDALVVHLLVRDHRPALLRLFAHAKYF